MNSKLLKNQQVYETPNKDTILKPRNLWTKEQPMDIGCIQS
jgi:hypothetical protein